MKVKVGFRSFQTRLIFFNDYWCPCHSLGNQHIQPFFSLPGNAKAKKKLGRIRGGLGNFSNCCIVRKK
ncbi:MAG: hypothetical protein ACUVRN_09255 [Candidatus Caldatribacteriaceae bacterium]